MSDLIDRVKWLLQTLWTDRYNAEPVYIAVPEEAVARIETAALDILSDPGAQFSLWPDDRERLVSSVSQLTGKPRCWYDSFIAEERERREALRQFHDCHIRGGIVSA